MAIKTLSELFLVAAGHDKPDCLLHKVDGRYVPVSTRQLVDRVHRLAKALAAHGIERGDRIALMAENGPHWPVVDFATLCSSAVMVPVYPTLLPEGASYIVRDSASRILFVEGRERLEGLLALRDQMPSVKLIVLIEEGASGSEDFTTLDALLQEGGDADPAAFEARAREPKPEDLATFIYTSGTTGNPKGVMLTHENITSNVLAGGEALNIQPHFTALSFLPLSHSFERTVDYVYFHLGVTIAYAESVQSVPQNLQEVRPHVFVSVPRLYEKFLSRVHERLASAPALRQKIFRWATEVGRQALPYRLTNQSPPGLLGLKLKLADKLVFGKIRDGLGGRFVEALSGGAPLGRDVAEFFWGAGVAIFEGYGLTETSPVLTVNTPEATRMGTVGRAIRDVELRIAEDGEILARGPNIMKGYYNNPDATAEAIDSEGWFHTGDIGQLDDGFLSITDRKKELIVNAYGKNIAPAPIENALKSSPLIEQAVVIGDREKFLIALLVPAFESIEAWAKRQGIELGGRAELLQHHDVREQIAAAVEKVNEHLARYEKIRAWELLEQELTLENGELTPTQKIKRRVILSKYAEVIARTYQSSSASG